MLTFGAIMFGSSDPKKLSAFYSKVFNVDAGWSDGDWSGFQVGAAQVAIGPHDKVKGKNPSPERIMLNLETTDVASEFKRIEGYGTTVIAKPYEMGGGWIATFEDPDGNYFQLITPMK